MTDVIEFRIPSIKVWLNNTKIKEGDAVIYIHTAKTTTRTGLGTYSEAVSIQKSYRREDHRSVLS